MLAVGVVVLGVGFALEEVHDSSVTHRRSPAIARRPDPAAAPALGTVVLAPNRPSSSIPRSFLGFSTEYWTLPVDERHAPIYRRIISLLHAPGDGGFVLRIGGVSSDHSFWEPRRHRLPSWAFPVTSRWISDTARIVRQSRLRVIIDLNLVTATSARNAILAREVEHAFPRRSIAAFEIGNEPDVYNRGVWGYRLQDDRSAIRQLPLAITSSTYVTSFGTVARALAAVAPRVGLQGPALAGPRVNRDWISQLLTRPHPGLDAITVHVYPYTACARPGAPNYPTVAKLLSPRATAVMAAAVRPAVALAHRDSLPVRVSEFNSVTCGGVANISNSFATALWAPSALFSMIRAGISAADLHVRAFSVNTPFRFGRHGLVPHPLLYGLVVFMRMLGPGSRLVPLRARATAGVQLHAWAVIRRRRQLNVLLIDDSARAAKVDLKLPSRHRAIVQRLLAPSARARTGETFAGQRLGADARWHGHRHVEVVTPHHGHYVTIVRGTSASLITLPVDGPEPITTR